MKNVISRFIMILGAILFIGILFSRDFRLELGLFIDSLMLPFSGFKFHIVIFIMSIITGLYSNVIQKYTVDYKKLKYAQKVLREYQKEYMEATKQNNQFKLKQLEQRKEEIQKLQSDMMSMQFKPMFYTFVVTIPIFAWLWEKATASYELIYGNSGNYGNLTANLPAAFLKTLSPELFLLKVPFSGEIHVVTPVLIFPWWLFWYLLCSITVGQIIKKVLRVGV
ncbi:MULTISPECIES: DUF106 domain-containing protein [unclassified Archaeoglobus]|jgi:uncharacterized membrane protein (DUF106 family)|uniref:DUF106 domain-containing protein n=1 Tax=unclassified Archaeoglobus TaxID=2643606 RepID=UPI0025C39256|nr:MULTISPECIES: DUF106 domain-containing protein [unclassified Archaeoglobus]